MALAHQAAALVGHQGDQGADDDREARRRKPGQLVAEALPPAGRHDDEGVPAGERRVDRLSLAGAKGAVAEVGEQGIGVGRPVIGTRGLGVLDRLLEALESLECQGRL